MRAGWLGNVELRKRLWRADPTAGLIAEVVVSESRDIKDTYDEWSAADSGAPGFRILEGGGITIQNADTALVSNTNANSPSDDITSLPGLFGTTVGVLLIEWTGNEEHTEIHKLTAHLDPDYDDNGAEVEEWVCQMFRVARILNKGVEGEDYLWRLAPISQEIHVTAGASAGDVEFIFAVDGEAPKVGPAVVREQNANPDATPKGCNTIVMIWAVKGEGEEAGNVAWLCSADPTVVSGTHVLSGVDLSPADGGPEERGSTWTPDTGTIGTPIAALVTSAYTEATVTFSTASPTSNLIDLGSTPSGDVFFVLEASRPGGSALTAEVSDDGGSTWYEFVDGDKAGANNSAQGGKDLSSLAVQQTYAMRATLTPSASGSSAPTLLRMGAEAVVVTGLRGIANVVSWAQRVDPVSGVAEIPEAVIDLLQTGEKDYRDFPTRLVSENYPGQLEFRLWVGDWSQDRAEWLLRDRFLVDDYETTGSAIRFYLLSPMQHLRAVLPVFDPVESKREVLTYTNQSLKAVWEDIISGQLGLPGRYLGPGPEDSATTVTKRIEDSDGKEELDAIAALAGGTNISSQGRVKFVELHHTRSPLVSLSKETVIVMSAPAGLRNRITEFFVPYNWERAADNGRGKYLNELRHFHADAITTYGHARIDPPLVLEDRVAQWIDAEPLAQTYLSRFVGRLATGLKVWRIRTLLPLPHIEIGDPIAFETDRLVMVDPNSGERVKGVLWVTADVVGEYDALGREFDVWIRDWGRIRPTDEDVTRIGYANPRVNSVTVAWASDGTATLHFWTTDAGSLRVAGDSSSYQGRGTVQIQDEHETDTEGYVSVELSGTYDPGDSLYVTALGYEKTDGTGSESIYLFKALFERPIEWGTDCVPILDEDEGDLNLRPNRPVWSAAVYYKVYTSGTPDKTDVMTTGTLSTADEITGIHTFSDDGEKVVVGVVAVELVGGGGVSGNLHTPTWTYHTAPDRPEVLWFPYFPGPSYEGVRLVARDDSGQVRLYYRTYTLGDSAPAYTDSGLQSDPYSVDISVLRPAEGANEKVVEFYAEDADGNKSTDVAQRIYIDGNLLPTGSVVTDVNRSTGQPYAFVSTSDPDAGSWRMAVAKNGAASIAFNDSLAGEFAGNSFNGESPDLSAFKLTKGDYLAGVLQFFRTTSTTAATQNTSEQSGLVGFTIYQMEETENKVRSAKLMRFQAADGTRTYRIEAHLGAAVQSVEISGIYVFATSSGCPHSGMPPSWSYTVDITGSIGAPLYLADGSTPVSLSTGCTNGGVGSVTITPYDATGGSAGGGNAGTSVVLTPIGEGAPIAGSGLSAAATGDWITHSVNPAYQVVIQASDPSGSWGAGDAGRIWVNTS